MVLPAAELLGGCTTDNQLISVEMDAGDYTASLGKDPGAGVAAFEVARWMLASWIGEWS